MNDREIERRDIEKPCFACRASPRARGVLCATCAEGLVGDDACPEQISSAAIDPVANLPSALLIDGFGAIHVVVGRDATVGRGRKSAVCVAERTVSVDHAFLEHREKSNAWFVADRGSDNGTRVNDDVVERRFPLEAGDRLFIGRRVGFLFMPLEPDALDDALAELRGQRERAGSVSTKIEVSVGARNATVRVRAATEGGAVALVGGERGQTEERVQLSELELELLTVLHNRFGDEAKLDPSVRGFVPGEQLLERLSFKSEAPTHANLRGLVRKLRRKLADLDVIESRKGLGYRLANAIELD